MWFPPISVATGESFLGLVVSLPHIYIYMYLYLDDGIHRSGGEGGGGGELYNM